MRTRHMLLPLLCVLVATALAAVSVSAEGRLPAPPDARPGRGVTQTVMLSSYFPALANTAGDTPVFIMQGTEPGPTVLILGGTHGNEVAGFMTATLLIEHTQVKAGRVIVVPRANNSASTYSLPGWPKKIELKTPSGVRSFRYGSRLTNPVDQSPDPEHYYHYPTGMEYPGEESRNLDRNHPGKADGTLTQKIAYGFMELIKAEKPVLSVDCHEAPPGDRLAYMLIANPRCLQLAAMASVALSDQNLTIQVEQSSSLRGLSHREWGDINNIYPFIMETAHPGMLGPTSANRIVNDPKNPLWYRVAVHLMVIQEVLNAYDQTEGGRVVIENIPSMNDLKEHGLGYFLN